MNRRVCGLLILMAAGLWLMPATAALAQKSAFGGPPLKGVGGRAFGGGKSEDVIHASGKILPPDSAGHPILQVTATIKPGWHTFSITQPDGGPVRTRIKLTESPEYRLAGEFKNLTPFKSHVEPLFDNTVVEEHEGTVVWQAPLELSPGVDWRTLKIDGAVRAQACAVSCVAPQDYEFTAVADLSAAAAKAPIVAAPASPAATNRSRPPVPAKPPVVIATKARPVEGKTEYIGSEDHAVISGRIEPAAIPPGGNGVIVISGTPQPPYHIYALADGDADTVNAPTVIALRATPGLIIGPATPKALPSVHPLKDRPGKVQRYYEETATWTLALQAAPNARDGVYEIEGVIGYQTCQEVNCDRPTGARFRATITVGHGAGGRSVPLEFSDASYADAVKLAGGDSATTAQVSKPGEGDVDRDVTFGRDATAPAGELEIIELNSFHGSLAFVLVSSLLGGALLNLMPCVLPVIGLKVLSFAQQGGQSRGRVLALNLWYTAGVLVVFMALATLASAAKLGLASEGLGWGQQFSSTKFNIAMCVLVFSMALSFLGVWEIPLPGFVGSGKATELAAKEGASGAFFKGVMSTILATPCSGPFLGPVFGFLLKQPPAIVYLIFGCIGLGMASPYLLIGAFPSLVRWIPKPGAWMDTFKQIMGFVLLGTVVFLFTFLDQDYVVATFALLVGVWFGCWWIGRTPLTAELSQRLTGWLIGVAAACLIGWFSFTSLVQTGRPADNP